MRGLKPRIIRKMSFLSSTQWNRLEESWCAIMFTVTMNRDFNPNELDYALFWSIRMFKIWYITAALRGCSCQIVVDKKTYQKSKSLKDFGTMHDRLCKSSKTLSSWLQFATLSYSKNSTPREISWFPGWDHTHNRPTMPWMSGHLSRWKDFCLIDRSDHSLVSLAQIRTFGRSLPILSKDSCILDLEETLRILTTDNHISEDRLKTVESFAKQLGEKLQVNKMPVWTHFSVSHSASLESSQSSGGKAADLQKAVSDLMKSDCYPILLRDYGKFAIDEYDTSETRLDVLMLSRSRPVLYDCYGQKVIFPIWYDSAYTKKLSLRQLFDDNCIITHGYNREASSVYSNIGYSMLDILYRTPDQLSGQRAVASKVGDETPSLPVTTGKALLFWASGQLSLSGTYEPKPDWFIMIPDHDSYNPKIGVYEQYTPCPVWLNQVAIRYIPVDYPSVLLTSLAEPGAKTRGLGKGQSAFNIIGQTMRFMADPVFIRDGSARIGLQTENKLWQFVKLLTKVGKNFPPGAILMSSDYRRATDYMALMLIKALWRGFLSGLPEGHPFWVFSELIWSPRMLFLDQALIPDKRSFISTCGSFQGEPVSFLTLTLYNLVILNMTIHYSISGDALWTTPTQIPMSGIIPRAVCGDDVAALFPDARFASNFRALVLGTGMHLSKGKDGDSKRILIFCEDHVIADYSAKTKEWSFTFIDTIKCRLLTNMSRQGTSRVASILGKGRMVANQLDWYPNETVKQITVKIYYDLVDRVYSGWVSKMKLPMTLPASCGGLSLPKIGKLDENELSYARYVYWLTSQPKTTKNLIEVMKLRSLSHRYRYGVPNPEAPEDLLSKIGSFRPYKGEIDDCVDSYGIYDMQQVKDIYLLVCGEPMSALFSKELEPTYNDICLLARDYLGLVPIWDALDQLERHVIFTDMLTKSGKEEPESLSLNKWVKKASRYWRRIQREYGDQYNAFALPAGITPKDVNWQVQNYWKGFVFMRTFTDLFSKYGPSLALGINKYYRLPPTPRIGGKTHDSISLIDLREIISLRSAVSYEPSEAEMDSRSD